MECKHGALKRSCRICEPEEEIVELKQLLAEVMASPEYLTDSYYRELGKEFRQRYKSLCKS